MSMNVGGFLRSACDNLGLPSIVGEAVSFGGNVITGNWGGALMDGVEMFTGARLDGGGGGGKSNFTQPAPPATAQPVGPQEGGADGPATDPKQLLDDVMNGKKPPFMKQDQFDMMQLQMEMQARTLKITMLTDMLKSEHESRMEIARNLKA